MEIWYPQLAITKGEHTLELCQCYFNDTITQGKIMLCCATVFYHNDAITQVKIMQCCSHVLSYRHHIGQDHVMLCQWFLS